MNNSLLLRKANEPPRAGRRAPRRRFQPDLQTLEDRKLLSSSGVGPTDEEQYMLALTNRARSDPAAEGRRLLAIAASDPLIQGATAGQDLSAFSRLMSGFAPLPPLAFNTRLIEAARNENALMVAKDAQVHSPSGYLVNPSVATAQDGQAYFPANGRSWTVGENIYAYSAEVRSQNPDDYVNYLQEGFELDWGNPDLGHMKNLMAPGPGAVAPGGHIPFSEIGIGLMTGISSASSSVGPVLATQEFAWRAGDAFLTGVVFRDQPGTGFYRPGEGVGSASIQAVGRSGQGTFQVDTWGSGGYSLQLPAGTYDVTATGDFPPLSRQIAIGADNVAWDLPLGPNSHIGVPAPAAPVAVPHDNVSAPAAIARDNAGPVAIISAPAAAVVKVGGAPSHDRHRHAAVAKVGNAHPPDRHAAALGHPRQSGQVRHREAVRALHQGHRRRTPA